MVLTELNSTKRYDVDCVGLNVPVTMSTLYRDFSFLNYNFTMQYMYIGLLIHCYISIMLLLIVSLISNALQCQENVYNLNKSCKKSINGFCFKFTYSGNVVKGSK